MSALLYSNQVVSIEGHEAFVQVVARDQVVCDIGIRERTDVAIVALTAEETERYGHMVLEAARMMREVHRGHG